jgi:hypothetical protein
MSMSVSRRKVVMANFHTPVRNNGVYSFHGPAGNFFIYLQSQQERSDWISQFGTEYHI